VRLYGFNDIIELFATLLLEGLELVTQMQGICVRFKKKEIMQKYRQKEPTLNSTPLDFVAFIISNVHNKEIICGMKVNKY